MSSRPIYDPQPGKISPQKCYVRSRFWCITSTVFVQTLSYLTHLRLYITRRQQYAVVTVVNTCNISNRLIYDPQPGKNTPRNCPVRSRFWCITSTVFIQTLSYLTHLRVYIIRRQQYAVVTVFNTCNISNRLIYDPQPGKNTPRNCRIRSRSRPITSTIFVKTLFYLTQFPIYVIRR